MSLLPSGSAAQEVVIDGRRYLLVPAEPVAEAGPPVAQLTARELEIVRLVARGHVNKQVADALKISEHTVATHLRRIYAKLHVDTRAAMVDRCQPQLQRSRGLASARG